MDPGDKDGGSKEGNAAQPKEAFYMMQIAMKIIAEIVSHIWGPGKALELAY